MDKQEFTSALARDWATDGRWDGITRPADHTAIIGRDVFNRAQRALQSRVKIAALVRSPSALPLAPAGRETRISATAGG